MTDYREKAKELVAPFIYGDGEQKYLDGKHSNLKREILHALQAAHDAGRREGIEVLRRYCCGDLDIEPASKDLIERLAKAVVAVKENTNA